MLLRYTGDGIRVSFITNNLYKARESNGDLGEGYAIFDEGDDWYWYGKKYVEENFDVFSSEKFETAGSVAV